MNKHDIGERQQVFLMVSEIPKDVEIQEKLTSIHIDEWAKEDVFHLKWWLLKTKCSPVIKK
jgi:hypothetical protein